MTWIAAFNRVKYELVVLLLIFSYATYYYLEVYALSSRTINLLLIGPVYVALALSTFFLIVLKVRKARSETEGAVSSDPSQQAPEESGKMGDSAVVRDGLVFGIATILYVLLLDKVGFVVSSFLYVMSLIYFLGNRSFWLTIFLPAVVVGFLYLTMVVLLKFPLPEGWLI